MAINQQIGWSQEAILLRRILKQLERLTQIMGRTATSSTASVETTTETTTVV